jgi:hypothetical protein
MNYILPMVLLVIAAGAPNAQSPDAGAMAGTWTGRIGRSPAEALPIKVELKVTGGTAMSGVITGPPSPGEIRGGTYDASTGSLKLDVVVKDGTTTSVQFDGIVYSGVATGRITIDGQSGFFTMTKEAAAGAAQTASTPDAAEALKTGFAELAGWIVKAADLVPADKYTYQPTKTVRTFGQLVAHIVDGQAYYCGRASGKSVQWSDAAANGPTDKATVVAKLKQSMAACSAVYASGSGVPMLIANLSHSSLHYGNVVTYMRMLGLTPPSSS